MHVLSGVRLWPLAGTTDIPTFGVKTRPCMRLAIPMLWRKVKAGMNAVTSLGRYSAFCRAILPAQMIMKPPLSSTP
jgi:hypothetical protein